MASEAVVASSSESFQHTVIPTDIALPDQVRFMELVVSPFFRDLGSTLMSRGYKINLKEELDHITMSIFDQDHSELDIKVAIGAMNDRTIVRLETRKPTPDGIEIWEELLTVDNEPLDIGEINIGHLGYALFPHMGGHLSLV